MAENIDNIKYDEYVKNKIDSQCTRNQITIDETSKLVTLYNLERGNTGRVVDLKCPGAYTISIMGKNQIPPHRDTDYAHSMLLYLADDEGNEIDLSTMIQIYVEKVTDEAILVAKMRYSDVCIKNTNNLSQEGRDRDTQENKDSSDWYRFEKSIEFKHEDHLIIWAVTPDVNIDFRKTKFALDVDLWENDFYPLGKSKIVEDLIVDREYPQKGVAVEHLKQGYKRFFDELRVCDRIEDAKIKIFICNFNKTYNYDEDTPIEYVRLSNSNWLELYKDSGFALDEIIIAENIREAIIIQYQKGIEYYKGLNRRYVELKNNKELSNHIKLNMLTVELEELQKKLGCAGTTTLYNENTSCFNML